MRLDRVWKASQPNLVAVAALAVVLLAGPLAAAGYNQASVNAARTGTTPDAGPLEDETAFTLALSGGRAPGAETLLVDGAAYVPIRADLPEALSTNGIVRIDLADPRPELVIAIEDAPIAAVTDGSLLYVVRDGGVDAYPLAGGEPVWSWDHPRLTTLPHARTRCVAPALGSDSLYLLCDELSVEDPLPTVAQPPADGPVLPMPGTASEVAVFVAALDLTAGDARWVWTDEATGAEAGAGVYPARADVFDVSINLGGLALVGNHLLVLTQGSAANGAFEVHLRAFDPADGTLAWSRDATLPEELADSAAGQEATAAQSTRTGRIVGTPTGTGDEAYYVLRDLIAIDPRTSTETWRRPLPQASQDLVGGNAFALNGRDLFVASLGVLFKFDVEAQALSWSRVIGPNEHFDDSPLVLTRDALYARTHLFPPGSQGEAQENPNLFYAIDPGDGSVLWRHRQVQDPATEVFTSSNQFAGSIADGVLAIAGVDGTFTVIGRTAASLQPTLAVSDQYPAPGEAVTVDLSGTRAGAFGPATEYRAEWGDGTTSEWTDEPVLSHVYADAREVVARFQVRNEAGQTSSERVVFDVGGTEPNFVERAFARENQDATFGVLGLFVAGVGGVMGVARSRRRRGRLQAELDAIDDAVLKAKGNPVQVEATLAERRARVRGLVSDGRLDQGHGEVLERRLDDRARELRMGEMRELLDFLPYRMVTSLQEMLADGRISAWERESFELVLARNDVMTKAQKDKVRSLVEAWFERDSGA